MDRVHIADEVWLAVPATRRGRDTDPRVRLLCRAIGFGLIAVNLRSSRVEMLAQPGPYRSRHDTRRRIRFSKHVSQLSRPTRMRPLATAKTGGASHIKLSPAGTAGQSIRWLSLAARSASRGTEAPCALERTGMFNGTYPERADNCMLLGERSEQADSHLQ